MTQKKDNSTTKPDLQKKAKIIESVLSPPDGIIDLWRLRELALTEGGLVNDKIRIRAWPKLVGLNGVDTNNASDIDDGDDQMEDDETKEVEGGDNDIDSVVIVHKSKEGKKDIATSSPAAPIDENDPMSAKISDKEGVSVALSAVEKDNESEPDRDTYDDNESASSDIADSSLTISNTNSNITSDDGDDDDEDGDDEDDDGDMSSTSSSSSSSSGSFSSCSLKCLDAEQINRDVVRCTWHLLDASSQRAIRRKRKNKDETKVSTLLKQKQRQLGRLINMVFLKSYKEVQLVPTNVARTRRRKSIGAEKQEEDEEQVLRYYQGYHDVASVFLSAFGGGSEGEKVSSATDKLDLITSVLLQVSNSHFRDAMRSGFHHLCAALRLIILPLIGALDSEVHSKLRDSQMEPFFAISWIITWFSHDIRDTDTVKRLFDMFIVSHPLMPIYMSIAMVLHPVNRAQILETEVDFAAMHNTLANLPKNSCSVGWKVLSEGGYVSGDDDEEDFLPVDDTVRMPSDDCSKNMTGAAICSDALDPVQSIKVPFQDLIEMAISYMRRIPPRNLVRLAGRYYADTPQQQLLSESSSIALFQPPPSWGLASDIPTDELILRQREQNRQQNGLSQNDASGKIIVYNDGSDAKKRAFDAIIASGMGPDGEEEDRVKQRRKLILRRSMAVAMVSITWALVKSDVLPVPYFGGLWFGSLGQSSDSKNALLADQCTSEGVCLPKEKSGQVEGLLIGSHISAAYPTSNGQGNQRIKGGGDERIGPIRWIQKAVVSARVSLSDDAEIVTV